MATAEGHWFNNLTPDQHRSLLSGLRGLDMTRKIDYDSEFVKRVKTGMEAIVEGLVRYLENRAIRINGQNVELGGHVRLVKCGSFYNQTKLGSPSEFDFAIELRDSIIDARSPDSIQSSFRSILPILLEGIQTIELPPGWQHGGYISPSFGGFRQNGPAQMMQFVYADPGCAGDALHVTADLMVVTTLDNRDTVPFKEDSHYNYLADDGYWEYTWRTMPVTELTDYTHSPAEKAWLDDCRPPVKDIIRILKCLNAPGEPGPGEPGLGDLSRDYLALHRNELVGEHMAADSGMDHIRSTKVKWLQLSDMQLENVYLMAHREIYSSLQYFPSYLFQSMVLMIHNVCFREDPRFQWGEDDIPRITITVLESILAYLDAWRRLPADQADLGPVAAEHPEWEIALNDRRYSSRRIKRLMKREHYDVTSSIAHVTSMLNRIQELAGVRPSYEVRHDRPPINRVCYKCVLLYNRGR